MLRSHLISSDIVSLERSFGAFELVECALFDLRSIPVRNEVLSSSGAVMSSDRAASALARLRFGEGMLQVADRLEGGVARDIADDMVAGIGPLTARVAVASAVRIVARSGANATVVSALTNRLASADHPSMVRVALSTALSAVPASTAQTEQYGDVVALLEPFVRCFDGVGDVTVTDDARAIFEVCAAVLADAIGAASGSTSEWFEHLRHLAATI